ncbi:MAG TPA: DUF222 domain-containing protein, partial [Pseudonocardiaceae bacterium]
MTGGVRQLGERMRELHQQIAQLQAELIHCVGEFDTAQGYELDAYRSTQTWLRYELRMHPRDASQLVGIARQVRSLPVVDQAFAAGRISQAHVAVIARTARQVGTEQVAASEQTLVDVASTHDPDKLRITTQHLR